MSVVKQLSESMVTAMKAKDSNTLNALRGIKSEFQKLDTDEKAIVTAVTEDDRLKTLKKMVKQRNDAAEIYKTNNRQDLYEKEVFEISVIEKFLPKQLSAEEIEEEIKTIIAGGAKQFGAVMGIATKKLVGLADGKIISEITKRLLA